MGLFEDTSRRLVGDLQRDFGWSRAQAVGVTGQLAHESGGFRQLQEVNPVVPGSRGGWGFAQWTGVRRREFESYADSQGLGYGSYEANYGYLKQELTTGKHSTSGDTSSLVKGYDNQYDAGRAFTDDFLRPGVPGYNSRDKWTGKVDRATGGQGPNEADTYSAGVANPFPGSNQESTDLAGEGDEEGFNSIGKFKGGSESQKDERYAKRGLEYATVRAGQREGEAIIRAADAETASDQKIAERYSGVFSGTLNYVVDTMADFATRFFLVIFGLVLIGGGIFLFSKTNAGQAIASNIAQATRKRVAV